MTENPRPPLGTKVRIDGMGVREDLEGRVRGYVQARHAEDERSVVVDLKHGFWGDRHARAYRRSEPMSPNIFLSSILVHASNLLDAADGKRKWALPEELS